MGENGTGKSTFIRMLAGVEQSDDKEHQVPELNVSYKPQKLVAKSEQSVRDLFLERIRDMFLHPQFQTDVIKPFRYHRLTLTNHFILGWTTLSISR